MSTKGLAPFQAIQADPAVESVIAAASVVARRRFWMGEAAFRASIVSVKPHAETYQRVLHFLERRKLKEHVQAGESAPPGNLMSAATTDPWSLNAATIQNDTRASQRCGGCNGSGAVVCPRCRGSCRASCSYCWGTGRVAGRRRGGKQCPQCKGRGVERCSCGTGQVGHDTCNGSGRVTGWLSMEQTYSTVVLAHPRNAAAGVHHHLLRADDFDSRRWINQLDTDTGKQASLPIDPSLQHKGDGPAQRVIASRLQTFSSAVFRITIATPLGSGVIDLAGTPPKVADSSQWRVLRVRQWLSIGVVLAGVVFTSLALDKYRSQHSWFETYGGQWQLVALGVIASVLAASTLARTLVPAPARNGRALLTSLALAALYAVGIPVAAAHYAPSAPAIARALNIGDLSRADAESSAMLALNPSAPDARSMRDHVLLARTSAATSLQEMVQVVALDWSDDSLKSEGAAKVKERFGTEMRKHRARRDAAALEEMAKALGATFPQERDSARWLACYFEASRQLLPGGNPKDALASLATMARLGQPLPEAAPEAVAEIEEAAKILVTTLPVIDVRNLPKREGALEKAVSAARAFIAPQAKTPQPLSLDRPLAAARKQLQATNGP